MTDPTHPPLVGGHPVLDLVNSLERGTPRPDRPNDDFLTDPSALLGWAERSGLLADHTRLDDVRAAWERDPRAGGRSLADVVAIREAVHTATRAVLGLRTWDSPEVVASLELLHSRWRAALGRSRITAPAPDDLAVRVQLGSDPTDLVGDEAVQRALELLTGDELGRLRECPVEAGGCGWVFLDRTRNGSRRWCRMADCGNKVKAHRLTEHRRAARARSEGVR